MMRYAGNADADGTATRGWFVGHFVAPAVGGLRSTADFETKWCVCQAGDRRTTPAPPATGTTLVILVAGRLRLLFEDGELLLSHPSDYALWNDGGTHSWIADADSTVITFRTPSARR